MSTSSPTRARRTTRPGPRWKIYEDTGKGKVRAIGVSNFGVPILKSLLDSTNVVPAVNQVELHPCLPSLNLRKFAADNGIVITAYSPIGQPAPDRPSPLLTDESISEIAKKHGVSEGQVALSWGVQNGIVVVPKSENPDRIKANISVSSSWSSICIWPMGNC